MRQCASRPTRTPICAEVDGVVVPVLQRHEVELGAVADDDRRGCAVARRCRCARTRRSPSRGAPAVRRCDPARGRRRRRRSSRTSSGSASSVSAGHVDEDRSPAVGDGKRRRRSAGLVSPSAAASSVVISLTATPSGTLASHFSVAVGRLAVEQAPQPLERREPPDLLAAGRHRVVVEVERRHRVQVARDAV